METHSAGAEAATSESPQQRSKLANAPNSSSTVDIGAFNLDALMEAVVTPSSFEVPEPEPMPESAGQSSFISYPSGHLAESAPATNL
jgi:hypothetical protein